MRANIVMRSILLDHNVPAPLCRLLTGHNARTAFDLGWATLTNGDLIAAAETGGFEVLVTADTNIRYQQNLTTRRIALVVLETNHWPTLRVSIDRIDEAVSRAIPGGYASVRFERPPLRRRPFGPASED
jgi:hypothetical protein